MITLNSNKLNQQINGLSIKSDSTWKVVSKRSGAITWKRTFVVFEYNIDEQIRALKDVLFVSNDFPGWTGVEFAPGLSSGNVITFVSTYDSGD